MASRVEISGVNTSQLPKLTHKETIDLIKKAQKGDANARDTFLLGNMRLVLSVVQKFMGKKENIDDIFQVGFIGLIKAMNNFDVSYNLRFSTYAVPMIIGEIRRFLRDNSAVRISRSIRDTAYQVLQTRQLLEATGNIEASLEQIAATLDMPLKKVVYAMDAISDPVSLFDPVYQDSDETVMIMDQISDPRSTDENWIKSVCISEAMNALTEREKLILLMRFYEGKTQVEVADEIGISQAQVSRLEKTAICDLKSNIY